MENNKQQTGLDWYITKRHEIEIESRLGHLPPDEYDEELKKAERQAKEMEKERIENAFNSGYNNGGSNIKSLSYKRLGLIPNPRNRKSPL
jgi:hypothetical protein